MGDYYCHGINVTQMRDRNADLSKANIGILEENAKLRAENAEYKSHNEYLQGDAGLADMVIDRLKADNAELRKLVVDAWWADRSFDSGSNNKRWEQWSAQHPVLQQDPPCSLNDQSATKCD